MTAGMRSRVVTQTGKTEAETDTATVTRLDRPWNVVVLDDPVTLMAYVTRVFMEVFGYPEPKAKRLMLEVHTTGRSIVWTGAREQAEVYVQKLSAYHLLAKLEQVSE
jgi:ATP-dependent Clp protease adaptor protein ClpS